VAQLSTELEVGQIQKVGGPVAGYIPLAESQARFHLSSAAFRWLFGGNQSSKTYTNMMDLAMVLLNLHPVSMPKDVGVHWACIETWDMVRDILWLDNLSKFIPKSQIANISYGPNQIPHKLQMRNGRILEFKAFKQGRELFQGRAINTCHCDEQCRHNFKGIFEEIQARLLKTNGRLSWSMTPIIPQPELEERTLNPPKTDAVFYANLNANRISRGGYIPDERIDAMIADWAEEIQATRIEGRFASYYGAVYKGFNRQVHVIKPFEIPESWDRYRGVDFGFTNPFVCLWAAKDKDENWYVYREYYRAKAGIQEHIANVKARSIRETYVKTFADPENAEDRNELRKAGIPNSAARKEIARGIELVQSKLKIKENGKPSLFFFKTCRNTCREMATYRYPEGTASNDPKDVPLAKNDHTCDALRYILYSVLRPGKKGKVVAA